MLAVESVESSIEILSRQDFRELFSELRSGIQRWLEENRLQFQDTTKFSLWMEREEGLDSCRQDVFKRMYVAVTTQKSIANQFRIGMTFQMLEKEFHTFQCILSSIEETIGIIPPSPKNLPCKTMTDKQKRKDVQAERTNLFAEIQMRSELLSRSARCMVSTLDSILGQL